MGEETRNGTPVAAANPPAPAARPTVELDPRPPNLRRIGRASFVLVFLGILAGITFLSSHFARRGLEPRERRPAEVSVRPISPSQMEATAAASPNAPRPEVDEEAGTPGPAGPVPAPGAGAPALPPVGWGRREAGIPRRVRTPMAAPLEVRRPQRGAGGDRRVGRGVPAPSARPGSSLLPADLDAEVTKALAGLAGEGSSPAPAPPPDPRVLRQEGPHAVRVSLAEPLSPYLLSQGTYVPAVLAQALASDLAGPVRAYVARDVFDTVTGTRLLLPRGTLALGREDRVPLAGESRLLVLWERLVFPDGRSLDLADLPAAAGDGALGLPGSVHRHWGRRVGTAALLALAGAGVQLSQPQRSAAVGAGGLAPDPGQLAAGELGLELGRLSEETLRRELSLPPTIRLPAGSRVFLLLTRDLAFDAPYGER